MGTSLIGCERTGGGLWSGLSHGHEGWLLGKMGTTLVVSLSLIQQPYGETRNDMSDSQSDSETVVHLLCPR